MNVLLRKPANDNVPFSAQFTRIPKLFLDTYQAGLMDWAKNIMKGNVLRIDLLNYPEGSILSGNWQGQAKLRCDALGNQATGAVKFIVGPASEEDEARIRKHCEELPTILAAMRAKEAERLGKSQKMARWVFDTTVPEYFVLRYQGELRAWAANLKKIGTTKHIILREGSLADLSPDEELGAELVQVALKCRLEGRRGDEFQIVVSAADEEQDRRIARHCEKMERNKIPALVELVEPERPYMPFMPKIEG